MSEARPGIHVAIYCQEPLLHAVAQTSFEGHVRQLVNAGRMAEALRLWDSVVEIQHLPLPDPQPIRPIPGLPPMRRAVCTAQDCARCENHRGGFQFPWVGRWTQRGTLVWPGTHPARGPWTFCSSICWRRTSQPRIFARVSGTQHCSLHPLPLGVPHWQRWLCNGGSGSWVRGFGLTPLQMCCHSPWARCQELGNSPGVLSMVGWLCQGLARGSAYRLPADGVGRHRVGFVRHATSRFARLVWGRHSGPSAVTTTPVTRPTTLKS